MWLFGLAKGILGNGLGMLRDYFEHKRAIKAAKVETELAIRKAKVTSVIKLSEAGEMHKIRWAELMAEGSQSSWKDEWFTVVLSIPILAAMAGYGEVAERAFEAMREAPEWYVISFLTAVGASFGVRIWEKTKTIKKNGVH